MSDGFDFDGFLRMAQSGAGLYPPYPNALPQHVERFVQQHGDEREGSPVPAAWRRRRTRSGGGCYAAASRWSTVRETGAAYTEGRALYAIGPDLLEWLPHAWLLMPDGSVIDLAWGEPSPRYHGVRLPVRVAASAHVRLGCHGPLLPVVIAAGWTPGQERLA